MLDVKELHSEIADKVSEDIYGKDFHLLTNEEQSAILPRITETARDEISYITDMAYERSRRYE